MWLKKATTGRGLTAKFFKASTQRGCTAMQDPEDGEQREHYTH